MATDAPQAVPAAPSREDVDQTLYGTALLILEESWSRGLMLVRWEYEPFEHLGTAENYAASLRNWADQEAEDYGEECYVTVVFKAIPNKKLEVKSVKSHGFTNDAAEQALSKVVLHEFDSILFSDKAWSYNIDWDGDTPVMEAPTVIATKGVKERGDEPLVKPKPIRKKPAAKLAEPDDAPKPVARRKRPTPAAQTEPEAAKPLVRSRGIRSKVKADRKVS